MRHRLWLLSDLGRTRFAVRHRAIRRCPPRHEDTGRCWVYRCRSRRVRRLRVRTGIADIRAIGSAVRSKGQNSYDRLRKPAERIRISSKSTTIHPTRYPEQLLRLADEELVRRYSI